MSAPSTNAGQPAPAPALDELRLVVLVALLLVLVFVLRQAWLQHAAVANSRPNVERLKEQVLRFEQIKEEFARFGSSHPDFLPILAKYGVHPGPASVPKP